MSSTGRTRSLGQIRGPLQFGLARSISPVYPVDHAITRVTQTTQEDIDAGERTEMGGKWTIPYALYKVEMHYSAARGAQTGVTSTSGWPTGHSPCTTWPSRSSAPW